MMRPVVLAVAVATVLAACSKPEPVAEPPRPVVAQKLAPVAVASGALYTGEVRARYESDLAFRITGKIIERKVDVGAGVRPGQVLARLDPADAGLNAEAARAQLVPLLHPTPAVGCLPRDAESMEKLREYRQQLKVPGFFGAPFGFIENDGTTHVIVAIRGICWEGDKISLPSGCGIVGGSAFDHEWRELRLKREAVLRLLALHS